MSHKMNLKCVLTCGLAAVCLSSPAMAALNTRSWVSRFGSDQNDCSMGQPCLTFQRAHDQTTTGGEVGALDPGDFGPVLINHAITLDGGNRGYISNSTNFPPSSFGLLVNAPPTAQVIVRNLSITLAPGSGNTAGIRWGTGRSLYVEGVAINGFSTGIEVLSSPDDGRLVRQLFVSNASIRNCTAVGILMGLGQTVLSNLTVKDTIIENIGGEAVGVGIEMIGGRANVTHTLISTTNQFGVYVVGAEMNLENSSVVYGNTGLFVNGNGIIRMASNDVHHNKVALLPQQGQIISFGTNRIAGNSGGETPNAAVSLK